MPKKIIICADGTWNSENATDKGRPCPTNVVKVARAVLPVAADGTHQVVFYHSGVGTNFGQRVVGGAFGAGLFENVLDCYRFLTLNFHPGDVLYLFGFSRGAFTVRSLAGLIRNSGILMRGHEHAERQAVELYRDYSDRTSPDSELARQFRAEHCHPDLDIHFIGVWDTVGALGIPGLTGRFRLPGGNDWQFHDVGLSRKTKNAFHALAIHEHRKEFLPTLWAQKPDADPNEQTLEQVWFPGVHSDVGGGYPDSDLADVPLLWMIGKAKTCGLEFDESLVSKVVGNVLATGHDAFSFLFKVIDFLGGQPDGAFRSFGATGRPTWEDLHLGAIQRFHEMDPTDPWPNNFADEIERRKWPLETGSASAAAAAESPEKSALGG